MTTMQTTIDTKNSNAHLEASANHTYQGPEALNPQNTTVQDYKVIRRNGSVVGFEPQKITIAMTKAFLAINSQQGAASQRIRELVEALTTSVLDAFKRRLPSGGILHIEDIQDQVELALMRSGEHEVARAYVLYRAKRQEERAKKPAAKTSSDQLPQPRLMVNGQKIALDISAVHELIKAATSDISHVDADAIYREAEKNFYDGMTPDELNQSLILSSRTMMEREPGYNYVTARLLIAQIQEEVFGIPSTQASRADRTAEYQKNFARLIKKGVEAQLINPELERFDLARLAVALKPERDEQFGYIGIQTLYDRYFLHIDEKRIEMPQTFFMRVAMGLALNEIDRETRAIEFYDLISSFDFMCSTPTLFNSGTLRSQLSSCYLTTVSDDLDGIYESIKDNALLAKYAGGLGNDWTPVRALGAHIKGTNGKSQGVVPFLKVVNDTAVAVNQGGKRKGAICAYLETWHLDVEEFLELRKNTGDDRRRTHDMNTANWVPDLFMKRVMEQKDWTLFSPSEVPDLHDKYGRAFEIAYTEYEARAQRGDIKLYKTVPAINLWRKMLSMLFETGHPWITFKDPCNIRSPQQHVGVVHSSNLCTEITLNTSADEIAVCNLGSVNLSTHISDKKLDHAKLQKTITTAMRMLDNVIDINYYAVSKARVSNLRHRPVGMGMMGFQDSLHMMQISYASEAAVEFADRSTEALCYYAYLASSLLAKERGTYASYQGSSWQRGILPHDTLAQLEIERQGYLEVDRSTTLDWDKLKKQIAQDGMRNSNCVAIAPTATISNIIGVSPSIEPNHRNLYVKSNLSGEFTEVNEFLVRDLRELNIWDEVMVADLKYFDGSLVKIDRIPETLHQLYATAYEVDPSWLVEAASRRQKWIDQAQSLNIYMAGASGKKLDDTYKLAWLRGLKTTYYLRSVGKTDIEKSTIERGKLNAVNQSGGTGMSSTAANTVASSVANASASLSAATAPSTFSGKNPRAPQPSDPITIPEGMVCAMRPGDAGFEECEACQ